MHYPNGREYWDGGKTEGYGGYKYDGRWSSVANKIIDFYNLTYKSKVLEIGCGKGFLLFELQEILPGLDVVGIDTSKYAIDNAK